MPSKTDFRNQTKENHSDYGRKPKYASKKGKENTYTGSRASEEDQAAQVPGARVTERAGGVLQRSDTICLDGAADQRRAPGGGGTGGLLGLDELLLGVGGLGAVVGVAEEGGEDGEGGRLGEDGTDGNGRGLDRREICLFFETHHQYHAPSRQSW